MTASWTRLSGVRTWASPVFEGQEAVSSRRRARVRAREREKKRESKGKGGIGNGRKRGREKMKGSEERGIRM